MTVTAGVDPAAPVIIGTGQVTHRDRGAATSAAALIRAAAEAALHDTGVAGPVRERVATVGVTPSLSWSAADPAAAVARLLGLGDVRTVGTRTGGTGPLELLRHACAAISGGDPGVTLLAGGEAVHALAAGHTGPEPGSGAAPPGEMLGVDRPPSHPAEERAGLFQPLNYYPLFALATLTDRLRAGGVLTADPPPHGHGHACPQSDVDRLPLRRVAVHDVTDATVESWTVSHDRPGQPATAHVTCLLPDGARAVAATADPGAVTDVLHADPIGGTVRLAGDATFVR